jgi:hypothetical protein
VRRLVLALILGWVLHLGKDVFIPIVFGILVVYVIVALVPKYQRSLLATIQKGAVLLRMEAEPTSASGDPGGVSA